MLNIMPMTTAITLQFVYDFMTRLAKLGTKLIFPCYFRMHDAMLLFLTNYAQY